MHATLRAMFNPSQEDVRRFFCAVAAKTHESQPLDALETLAGQWLQEHPEYDAELGDVDAALPLWTEVPIRIRLTGGASWTDYGWEHDGEVVWEVVSVPALTFPVNDSAQACGTGIDGGTP